MQEFSRILLLLAVVCWVAAQTCSESRVHRYEFDDAATLFLDSISPGSGDGLPVNVPEFHSDSSECLGGSGGCLFLDNEAVPNGHGFELPVLDMQDWSSGFTLSFWAKRFTFAPAGLTAGISALATFQDSASPRYGDEMNFLLAAGSGGSENVDLFVNMGAGTFPLVDDSDASTLPSEWIHYALVETRGMELSSFPPFAPSPTRTLDLYVNGALVGDIKYQPAGICELPLPFPQCKPSYSNATRISIGFSARNAFADEFSFHGLIDDVSLYDCPLSFEDIATLADNSRVCTASQAQNCSEFAYCERVDGVPTCTCRPGFTDESGGAGTACADMAECLTEPNPCHYLAYCDESPGSFVCSCPTGFYGDGITCKSGAWAIRTVITTPSPLTTTMEVEALKLGYAEIWFPFGANSLRDAFTMSMHVEADATGTQFTLNALFETREEALAIKAAAMPAWEIVSRGAVVDDGPEVYRWIGASTSDELSIRPTGLTVDNVFFQPDCLDSGCWVVEVTYTVGEDDFNVFFLPRADGDDTLSVDPDYSTPHASYSYSPAQTFSPSVHPCTGAAYDGSLDLPAYLTPCCIPGFHALYRTVSTFESVFDEPDYASLDLSTTGGCFPEDSFARDRTIDKNAVPQFARTGEAVDYTWVFPKPGHGGAGPEGVFVAGTFSGMAKSNIHPAGTVDKYVGIYKAVLKLDEVELRTQAAQLKGTVGVEHALDTFVGLADFSLTGSRVMDTFATQVNLHLEKTSFFSVSTHGTNDYTFLQYVNVRLVAVYQQDKDFSGVEESDERTVRTNSSNVAHYVQVTFTLGAKYGVNDNGGLIPLTAVRAGKGTFFSEDLLDHKCLEYTRSDGYSFARLSTFKSRFPPSVMGAAGDATQTCAPEASMCQSPSSIPDSFISFNIPLGVDWLPEVDPALASNVFVHLVINAIDETARGGMTAPSAGEAPWQVKTTLSASVPVVAGGVHIFCDGITAKTDLKDVANVDVIVGSASSPAELTRLRIIQDIASTSLDAVQPQQIDSASIEAGLLTLVIKGNASYFNQGGTSLYSLELEDVVTIHLMESDGENDDSPKEVQVRRLLSLAGNDNGDSAGLDTDGYKLNGAFRFSVDTANDRAYLDPTPELLAWCPFNPPRPSADSMELETCVTRRDVRYRGYPKRAGGVSSAMEIRPDDASYWTGDRSGSDEAVFMSTVLGASDYAKTLAVDFAEAIHGRYRLNGRYTRAYWINPGYEWTPTQTGGRTLFSVSQKLFLFALITLDEDATRFGGKTVAEGAVSYDGPDGPQDDGPFFRRRRMLLQAKPDTSGAGVGATELRFPVTPSSLMASTFGVPLEHVAVFKVAMQLTHVEACMSPTAFQAHVRAAFQDYLARTASALETVQVKAYVLDVGDEKCGRRRAVRRTLLAAAFSSATAEVEMLLVFAKEKSPALDLKAFSELPGIASIEAVSVASVVRVKDVTHWAESEDKKGNALNVAMIAGIAGGALAAVVVGAVAAVKVCKTKEEKAEVAGMGFSLEEARKGGLADLKAQLQSELCSGPQGN